MLQANRRLTNRPQNPLNNILHASDFHLLISLLKKKQKVKREEKEKKRNEGRKMAKLRYSLSTHRPHTIFQPQSLLATIHSRKRNSRIDPFVSLRACDRANFCHASHVSRHFSFNSMAQFRRCESAFGNASSQKRLPPTTINLSPGVVNAYRMSSFSVSSSSVVPFTQYKNTIAINFRLPSRRYQTRFIHG